eukprot:JP436329.1.p1 GENE.JP436329.1~~JP436329.1.p1  ORF type:complete len:223 (-),score=51.64 JP436329.1:197-829(-)
MFLVAVNTAVMIASLALIAIGIFVKVGPSGDISKFIEYVKQYVDSELVQQTILYASTAILVFGCLLLLVSFLGCCGACKESRCLLGTFFGVMLVLFIAQVVVAGFSFGDKTAIENEIQELVIDNWQYLTDDQKNSVMSSFSCDSSSSCAVAIEKALIKLLSTAGIALLVVACVQVIALVASCHLFIAVGSRQNEVLLDNVQKENRAYYAA